MANVFFKKSTEKTGSDIKLDTESYPFSEGTLYFTADQELYLDNSNKRQQIAGNIIYQDLENAVNPDEEGAPPTFGGHTVNEFLLKTDNIIPEIYISYIEITSNGTNSINIPNTINDYDNLMVYQNGLLLNENIHYSVNNINKTITLIDYYAKQGEIFTFTGPTYANDEVNIISDSNLSSGVQIKGISLLKNNWTQQKQYTLYLDGVKASLLSQSIQVSPDYDSLEEYANCEIKITRQNTNYLYFECSRIPSEDLYIYIIIQESVGG